MRCAKGIFAKGIWGCTGFSLLQWEMGKTKSTVKVGSWSAVKPPPGGPITVLFSAKIHKN